MNRLIKKIKYNILYNKVEYPLLHIVNKDDYSFFETRDVMFEQRDLVTIENLNTNNKKYNTIILENIEVFHLELLRLLTDDGTLYLFTDNEEKIQFELSKYFKFIKLNIFKLNLEFIPDKSNNLTQFSSNDKDKEDIKLVVASNLQALNFTNITSLSMNYLNTYLDKFFIDKELYLEKNELLKVFSEKLNQYQEKEEFLYQKQKIMKEAVNDLLIKINKNNKQIYSNQVKLSCYKDYTKFFVNNLNNDVYVNELDDIKYLEQLINVNIDLISNNLILNKEILRNKSNISSSVFTVKIESSSKNLDELKKLYKENNELINQNNLYVSEISHLKFDIKEVTEENKELIKTIKEFEVQVNDLDNQKNTYFNGMLEEFKKDNQKKIDLVVEKNKKLNKEIDELTNKVKKIEEKNKKNLTLLDEKGVLIQKLKLKIDEIKKDNYLKDELVNKKNLILRENDNKIAVLLDDINKKELLCNKLKKELKENNDKINSTYYKELYDNLEKKYKKIKNKNKELVNITQDYKKEMEQYEIKIQELIGYNERITNEIDIDLDNF